MKSNSNIVVALVPFFWVTHGYATPGGPFRDPKCRPNNFSMRSPEERAKFRREQEESVNRAFDEIAQEINKETAKSARKWSKENREFMKTAMDFASKLMDEAAKDDDDDDDDMEGKFRDFAKKGMGIAKDAMDGSYSPAYEINDENEDFLEISIDLPGVERSKIDIVVEDNVMIVSGERDMYMGKRNNDDDDAKPLPFSKSFPLDKNVDTNDISATLNLGVLVIRAGKKKDDTPAGKRIPIL